MNEHSKTFTVENLKFLSINTCGLKSKLRFPEFTDMINSYDIIGVQETKLDDLDSIHIPGYEIVCKHRKKISRYRSGGLAIIVKASIFPYISVHENDSNLVQWISISKRLTHLESDIICGNVYIPPYGSKYAHEDPYLEIQTEYSNFSSTFRNIILLGDFNSRTSSLPDFVIADEFISQIQNDDLLYNESMQVLNCLYKSNFPTDRKSADHSTNIYGKQLLEFCQGNDLFIINGRIGQDMIDPKATCKDRSTIDYFICSPNMIQYVCIFSVLDFSPFFSDSHCGIELRIDVQYHIGQRAEQDCKSPEKVILWNSDKADSFERNCDTGKIRAIIESLDSMTNKTVFKNDIDEVVTKIESVFESSCFETFGTRTIKHDKINNSNKPWFNLDCRNARNLYHKIRKLYNKHKTEHYKNLLKHVSKEYKNTVNRNVRKYKDEKIEKLRRLKTSNSKEFWRILNDDKRKQQTSAPLQDLYEYFKDINEAEANSSHEPTNNTDSFVRLNEEINKHITEDEIIKATNALKLNKSPGVDDILNEHIKSSIHIMLPVYVRLFNLIFDTGLVPESWLIGNILPIYKIKGEVGNPENYRPITLLSCLGKLFTAIINNRLNEYSNEKDLITHSQAGFRKGFSTTDNIFIIKSLIDILQSKNKKLFCAFVDFKQAFDTVWRNGLWYKLDDYNINGKCLNLIKNMYANIKSRIKNSEGTSPFFACCNGVRQGENLSPFLFSIFLNDLERYFSMHHVPGIKCEIAEDDIYVFLKVFLLLYADDTVIFGEEARDLQKALFVFENYCKIWKLTVNISKTKVLIFSKGRPNKKLHFLF